MSLAWSGRRHHFSKVLYIVTAYSKYTRALTFENLEEACRTKRVVNAKGAMSLLNLSAAELGAACDAAHYRGLAGMYPPPHMTCILLLI